MFCPKCHTELKDGTKFCTRCGTEQNSTGKFSKWGSFSSSKTFGRMNIKNTIDKEAKEIIEKQEEISIEDHNETHEKQYNYSKKYSNIIKDTNSTHETQFNFSTNYSNVTNKTDTPHEDQYNYSQQYSLMDHAESKTDKDYENAFIGKNFNWFQIKMSIPAVVFGPFYFLYRKMYGQAILLIILYLITYSYLQEETGIFVRFVLNIIFAIKANQIYLKEVHTRIENIKKRNQNADSKELLELCKKAGGTCSIMFIIIVMMFYFTVIALITIQRELSNVIEEPKPIITEDITNNEIVYRVPERINVKTNFSNYQHITDDNQYGNCYITIYSSQTNKNEDEYLSSLKSYYVDYNQSEVEEIEINQEKWKKTHYEKNNAKRDIYVFKYNGYMYDFQFSYSYSNACDEDMDYILESVERKKNN